jgi:hypothetical protein
MFGENDNITIDYNAYGDVTVSPNDEPRSARSADNYYHYYDGICRECTEKNGYEGKIDKDDNNGGKDVIGR